MVVTRRQRRRGYLANVPQRLTTAFYGQPPSGTTTEADDEEERQEMEVEEVEVVEEVVVDRQPRLQLPLPQQLQLLPRCQPLYHPQFHPQRVLGPAESAEIVWIFLHMKMFYSWIKYIEGMVGQLVKERKLVRRKKDQGRIRKISASASATFSNIWLYYQNHQRSIVRNCGRISRDWIRSEKNGWHLWR